MNIHFWTDAFILTAIFKIQKQKCNTRYIGMCDDESLSLKGSEMMIENYNFI